MNNIIERQTVVISVNFFDLWIDPVTGLGLPSKITLPLNLNFAADTLVIKSILYGGVYVDKSDVIQIWCNITKDGLIGAFLNNESIQVCNAHFGLHNTFKSGSFTLEFQRTDGILEDNPVIVYGNPASFEPQNLISSQYVQKTFNVANITIEFLRHDKK